MPAEVPAQSVRALGSRYRLEEILGSGAMGQVWRARDLRTQEACAAKLLREEFTADPQIVGRFVQERSILVELVHPHIVAVRDLVVDGGDLGIVMDLVEGEDLRAHLTAAGTLAPAEAVRITVDVLDALAAAHARNVLHRDVKPDNVLLDRASPPYVRLTDFGIARLAQETTVRMTGVLGTAEYIAPEVFTAETVSAAADVYGAGIQLYELLAGRTPFAGGGTSYAIAYRHVTTPPPPIPGLPAALAPVLAAMLAKSPTERPSAAAAAQALRNAAGSLTGLAPLTRLPEPRWQDAASQPVALEVHGQATGEIRDAQATSIKGELSAPAPPKPVAAPSPGAALHPAATPEALASRTQLQGPRVSRPVVDVPDAPELERTSHRRRNVLIGLLVLVLVGGGVAGGVTLLGGKKKSAPKAANANFDTATGTTTDPASSGLTVVRTATYDKTKKQLTMTIAYSTSGPDLQGPFLEAVVPAANSSCPTIAYAEGVGSTATDVDQSACASTITVATVTKSEPVTATYTIPYTLTTTNPDDEMAAYAKAEQTATDTALANLSGTDYAAQRLKDVVVNVVPPSLGKQISVTVLPVWTSDASGDGDGSNPLYSTANALANEKAPDYVTALGGVSAPYSTTCQGPITQAHDVLTASTIGQNCTVAIKVGGKEYDSTTPFNISATGS